MWWFTFSCVVALLLAIVISSRTAEIKGLNLAYYLDVADTSDDEYEGEEASQTVHPDWRDHWQDLEAHKQNLSRVFVDDHVTVYFDPHMNQSVTWPFIPLSQTWRYAKDTYGPFGLDPHLHVVLHGSINQTGCIVSTFWMKLYEFRNIIDCGTPSSTDWTQSKHQAVHLDTFLTSIAHLIRNGAKGVENIADAMYCSSGMVQILTYDLYLNLLNQNKSDGESQSQSQSQSQGHPFTFDLNRQISAWKRSQLTDNQTGCFKNWILPIYEAHGGSKVLNNYFNYTFLYWPQALGGGYNDYMNVGEWIHFWSGAAGLDLEPMGNKTIGWESWVEAELVKARKDYPYFSYDAIETDSATRGGGPLKLVVIAVLIFMFICVFLGGGILGIHRKLN